MVKGSKKVQNFVKTNRQRVAKRNIDGLSGVSKEIEKVYNEFRSGKIEESAARTMTYILRTKALVERDRYLDDIDKERRGQSNQDLIFEGW